jgi:hypothetical protein
MRQGYPQLDRPKASQCPLLLRPAVDGVVVSPSKILHRNASLAQILANIATFRLTIPIATARNGGSVQQRLSAAAPPGRLPYKVGAADKLYSLSLISADERLRRLVKL